MKNEDGELKHLRFSLSYDVFVFLNSFIYCYLFVKKNAVFCPNKQRSFGFFMSLLALFMCLDLVLERQQSF